MAAQTKTEEIGGERWSCTQMPATQALAIEARLVGPILQSLGPLFGALGQPDEAQAAAINQAFGAIAKAVPPAEFVSLIRELCEQAACEGKRVDFDTKFTGGKGVLLRYQVAWFVLRVNYQDFFDALLPEGAGERAQEAILKRMTGAGAVAA